MTTPLDESPLGRATPLPERYDPSLLFPVERADARAAIGVGATLPFSGHDAWTAWELAWLDASGRPQVAVGRFEVPATSPRIVESKSVKLYLASLNHERIESREVCAATIARDLSQATGAASIDAPLASIPDEPDPSRLTTTAWDGDETLHTSLFRSVCPVTGQPDYATVIVRYRGPRIERGPLLAYLAGFRRHPGFHESCVERIFVDLLAACRPNKLAVEARFTRRGGLDINPFRSSGEFPPPDNTREVRQ